MAVILSPSDVRAEINTSLTDGTLTKMIADVQARIEAVTGSLQDSMDSVSNSVVVRCMGKNLWLPQPILSVTSITIEDGDVVSSSSYRVWSDQGRIERKDGATWENVLTVVYKPKQQIERARRAALNMVRVFMDAKALDGESVGGEYSYQSGRSTDERLQECIRSIAFLV